ncbi:hypothetical protein, partial [Frankia sp. AgB32]|uniref:hypothetical protein n=1 Tax=Frankia sp. AgB32 TaxID=631119 RepID=UPI00200D1F8A
MSHLDEFDLPDPALFSLSRMSANEVLYDGTAIEKETGLECRLVVEACWSPRRLIRWQAEFGADLPFTLIFGDGEYGFTLTSDGAYSDMQLDGLNGFPGGDRKLGGRAGMGLVAGKPDQAANYVNLRWVNLHNMGDGLPLDPPDGIEGHRWPGRRRWILDGWEMIVDSRPDLKETLEDLRESYGYAVTHLARLRRCDRTPFTSAQVEPILFAYQLAASFALSRWASPSLSSGADSSGMVVWREWGVRRADAFDGVPRWWGRHLGPIEEIIDRVGRRVLHPEWSMAARLIIQGYLASTHGGFVEERITVGFAALEQLGWQRNVVEDGFDEKMYDRKLNASKRIRMALDEASIPCGVPVSLPSLRDLIGCQKDDKNDPKDGPRALALVRNRLMHPKDPNTLYGRKGLVAEAWLLLESYLQFLILHWVGYSGMVEDSLMLLDGENTLRRVPW